MPLRWLSRTSDGADVPPDVRLRLRYESCRNVIAFNNEALELLAGIQEDLLYVPPRLDVLGTRVGAVFEKAEATIGALSTLAGRPFPRLVSALAEQRREVERFLAVRQELVTPRLAVRLADIDRTAAPEVGDKAAALGEIRSRLGAPVPEGYALTTETYRQFFGLPFWERIRDAERAWDPDDLDGLRTISQALTALVHAAPLPRVVEVALTERAVMLPPSACGLAVRSSAVGEGGTRTFAGQFQSRIGVPLADLEEAYRDVIASRFSERALSYRLTTGLAEVDTPMAVLVLPTVCARAAGILYTRDPRDPRSDRLLISSTWGLGLDMASGLVPSDLFVVSRTIPHRVIESRIVAKHEEATPAREGDVERRPVARERQERASLDPQDVDALVRWGLAIEQHMGGPQDVEWAVDRDGKVWILQTRPLELIGTRSALPRARVPREPLVGGGRAIYPGRTSGPAFVVEDPRRLNDTPHGAILVMRRVTPDIVKVFPRLAGVVAEWGNPTGHAAALLREFKIPSIVDVAGATGRIPSAGAVSLDAGQGRVYAGTLWPPPVLESEVQERFSADRGDPLTRRLLALTLLEPSAWNFRPSGCKSAHDVLRFSHEKAIQSMFTLNDSALKHGAHRASRLLTPAPVNLHVLDLGGGLASGIEDADTVQPGQILCRPFQAIWRGMTHPGVNWNRDMRASFSGLASVMAGSLSASMGATRALGEKSYLLVSQDYMNLNSRLAYHFTLVDACVSDVPGLNYISFRFAGGGATRRRRSLRACFLEACLAQTGFQADRRGDVVNAWFRKAPAADTESRLDVLGRLMACASQLDMYMTGHDAVRWYVEQFLDGNYAFDAERARRTPAGPPRVGATPGS